MPFARTISPQRIQTARELHRLGLPYAAIGKLLGVGKARAHAYCQYSDFPRLPARVDRECQECGQWYLGPAGPHSRYCTKRCANRASARVRNQQLAALGSLLLAAWAFAQMVGV